MQVFDNSVRNEAIAIPWLLNPGDGELDLEIHGCGCGCGCGCDCGCDCGCGCGCGCGSSCSDGADDVIGYDPDEGVHEDFSYGNSTGQGEGGYGASIPCVTPGAEAALGLNRPPGYGDFERGEPFHVTMTRVIGEPSGGGIAGAIDMAVSAALDPECREFVGELASAHADILAQHAMAEARLHEGLAELANNAVTGVLERVGDQAVANANNYVQASNAVVDYIGSFFSRDAEDTR